MGRAGRRLRIGFVSTFCAGGAHDRHAFERPEWFVAGRFQPPRLRLDNPKVVLRHLRAYLLSLLDAQLPRLMGEFLDDLKQPKGWQRERLKELFTEVHGRRDALVRAVGDVMVQDRERARVERYGEDDAFAIVDGFERGLVAVLEQWWQRVKQLD